MKNQTIKENHKTIEIVEFDSLHEFYRYICETPFNNTFRWANHSSVSGDYDFTRTNSFEEATELFKNGWSEMASKLTQRLKVVEKETAPIMKQRNTYGVAGYQAIVPLYLNNCPNSMMYKKNTPVKQKVVTLDKVFTYRGYVSSETIIEESVKALQIIKKIESQGYRVNLNLVCMQETYRGDYKIITKIRIKNAGEKLNISKLAFPLVHPSMARRLHFRFREVFPTIPSDFKFGYGCSCDKKEIAQYVSKNEYILPQIIRKPIDKINGIEDLENL